MLQPPNLGSSVWFLLMYSQRKGATAAVLTYDTIVDESRKIADRVTRFPARFCSRDRKLRYRRRLEYDFVALVSCLRRFLSSFSPSLSRYVSLHVAASFFASASSFYIIVPFVLCVISILILLYLPCFS